MITHIVLLKMPDAQTAAEARDRLRTLDGQVPGLTEIEVGVNVVESPRAYDVALVTRFGTLDDLSAYQEHPAHLEVAGWLRSVMEGAVSVDYSSEDA